MRTPISHSFLGVIVVFVGACHPVGPDYSGAPGVAHSPRFAGGSSLPALKLDQWWRRLGSSELNRLVESSLRHNHDLAIAAQRLREARALRQQAASSFLPHVGSNLSYSRLGAGGLGGGGALGGLTGGGLLGSPIEFWSASLDASWEVDVFGGRRREAAGAQAREEAVREDLHGVHLAVASEVTET
jgi:outer membrane protein TolC